MKVYSPQFSAVSHKVEVTQYSLVAVQGADSAVYILSLFQPLDLGQVNFLCSSEIFSSLKGQKCAFLRVVYK